MNKNTLKLEFKTKTEALDWMKEEINDSCIDNERFAYIDNSNDIKEYNLKIKNGCCGFFDKEILVDGKPAMIGCNYGH